MFKGLQKKWKVNGTRLALILITFAVGGSLTGYAGRKLMSFLGIELRWLWIIVYIIIIVLLWPLAVLFISILTGQFRFFADYIRRLATRMKILSSPDPGARSEGSEVADQHSLTAHHATLAIFASGAGSNAQKIIDHFRNSHSIKVGVIVCNNPAAGVIKIAAKENIPLILLGKEKFFGGNGYVDELKQKNIDFIVLAGFLWKVPAVLIKAYPNRIVNVHPALLPGYGGKGMYGNNVHAAVIAAGEKESGITIHYVDEQYDNGDIILQVKCPVLPGDTADSLAQRIHQLEHGNYPLVIERLVKPITG